MRIDGRLIPITENNIAVYKMEALTGLSKEDLLTHMSQAKDREQIAKVWIEHPRQPDGEGAIIYEQKEVETASTYVRRLPAAAIPKGSVVRIEGRDFTFTIARIDNATPEAGQITWTDKDGLEEVVGGGQKIEVVELP